MEHVRWESRPRLRSPVLVAAFEGWNDAGEAASTAAGYLATTLDARTFATLDADAFYDFTEVRPAVRLLDGRTRSIDWPDPKFSAAPLPGGERDVVFLTASEPQFRWRSFCAQVVEVARELGVELVVTLGALLGEIPHTRPVRVIGTAADQAVIDRFGLQRSRYEGPTGIVGVLTDAVAKAGLDAVSLWATVPHYLPRAPSPKATLALVERAVGVLDVRVNLVDLQIAASAYERQVSEMVAADDEVAEYVRRLEEDDDEADDVSISDLPSGDELAADVERFLRDQDE